MQLTPEERRRIYEEEKTLIENRQKTDTEKQSSSANTVQGLSTNIAGLLCYIGGWISGVILLVLEEKNRFVRFHAAQSIVVFGSLNLISIGTGWIPRVGGAISGLIAAIGLVFWIVLMVKAYKGETYRVPLAGELADILERSTAKGAATVSSGVTPTPDSAAADAHRVEHFPESRAGRIAASAFSIAMGAVLLVLFNFFHQYIAYYNGNTVDGVTTWTRYPLFNSDIQSWLPILTFTLVMTVIVNIMLLIYDRYILRELSGMLLDGLGLATVVALLAIFPFDFSVIPDSTAADITHTAVTVVLIMIAVGLGISLGSRLVKLLVRISTGKAHY